MSYEKKTWVTKEIIKGVDLNHIEDGIAALDEQITQGDVTKAYKTTDATVSSVTDTDYIPMQTNAGSKKKVLFSVIKNSILNLFGDWAKQPNKPSYTASELNAVSYLANQGLTNDQKANARNNIGAGNSSFSGSYNDLTNKPTIGTGILTIQKNGTNVKTFSANATSDTTANITVPTNVSELNNDSGYITSAALPTVNNGTLTIQRNGTNVTTFSANQSGNATANITVPTKVSDLTNDLTYVSGAKGGAESSYRTGQVNITKANIGLGNVGDFLAVSTVANQGLTDEQKANARSNIGAGSSSFSGNYNDLSNKPTIGNGTLTIQKNGTNVTTFTANQTGAATANITVPTKTSDLTNDSGFITSASIPTVNNATLTIQKNGTTVKTFTANASSNVTANITVPTKTSDLTNDSGYGTVSSVNVGDTAYTPTDGVVSLPAYPTVNNAKLTIQKNGTTVKTFTANASSAVTCNITVPTAVSELTNDSGYITSASLPTVNNATLTIQKNGTTVKTFTANASSNVTANITVPTKTSELTNDSGYTANAGTVTSVATGVGLTGGTITGSGTIKAKLKSETASTLDSAAVGATSSRQYAVHPDKSGYLSVNVPWTDTIPSAYSTTAAGTATKVASCAGYALKDKSYIQVILANANESDSLLKLNINGTGAKNIYINGAVSSADTSSGAGDGNHTLPAGSYLVYYNSSKYYFRTDGKMTGSITGNCDGKVNGHTVAADVPSTAIFTDTRDFYLGTKKSSATANTLYFIYTT